MNFAHVHLLVNHLPLFAALLGGGILGYGLLKNQRSIKSVGLALGVIAALGGAAATFSGERAEDVVETYSGTNELALEEHEEAAEMTRWALLGLGIVSVIGLVLPTEREALRGRVEWAVWAMFVIALSMVIWTASIGGHIRHPEIDAVVELSPDTGGNGAHIATALRVLWL